MGKAPPRPAHSKRRGGRPKGTVKRPLDYLLNIWLEVESLRERIRLSPGRRPSVSKACDEIARGGGLRWIVGGNIDAISCAIEENPAPPFSDWRRFKFLHDGNTARLRAEKSGRVIVSDLLQHARTLRTRYTEADRLVRENPMIRAAWTYMLHDRLGLPRLFPSTVHWRISRPPIRSN